MNKLFDLRFVIGSFFTVVGLLLIIYGFINDNNVDVNNTINKWCGLIFSLFGVVMVLLSFRKDAQDELLD
ncbi:MAG TPA: hypothetical protein VF622_09570 [Segetibacter sp.]|jgi:putative Mn2+ efflux pump MntP